MDHDDDVERLFSWIKTPDLRYREFAGARDVADAVAAWPALRKTATETGHPTDAAEAEREIAPPEPPPSGRSPLSERLMSVFARREPAPPNGPLSREAESRPPAPEPIGDVPWAPLPPSAPPPIFTRFDPAPAPPEPAPVPSSPPPPPEPPHGAAPAERERSIGDTYRGFDDDNSEPPPPPVEDHPRSLDAVFSRLARPARNYRDERQRAGGGSGLGPVFRRLR